MNVLLELEGDLEQARAVGDPAQRIMLYRRVITTASAQIVYNHALNDTDRERFAALQRLADAEKAVADAEIAAQPQGERS